MAAGSGAGARAGDRPAAAAAAAEQPWQQALGGLQRNCQQLAANLARVQQQVRMQLHRPQQHRRAGLPVASLSQAAAAPAAAWSGGGGGSGGAASSGAVTREEVGRATWTFLHTLAAQYPEKPTRQQRRDARNLVRLLGGMHVVGGVAALRAAGRLAWWR